MICRLFNFVKTIHFTCQATYRICLYYWDPHLSKNILAIEGTQKFALRVCLKNWRADYDLLLNLAHLPRLSSRRKFLKLCLLFNIFTGKVAFHDSPLDRQSSPYPNRLQNSLQLSLYMPEPTTLNILFSIIH